MARTRAEILAELQELFQLAIGGEGQFDESSRLVEDIGLNSVGVLFLVVGIEESFGIRFGNVGLSDFITVHDIIDYIEGQMAL